MSALLRLLALTAAAVALASAAAPAAFAQPAAGPVPIQPTDADRDAWQQRVRDARDALVAAKQKRKAADDAYDEMRSRGYPRGDGKKKVIEERSAAREAEAASLAQLESVLEEARRAGVPPGWLRATEAPGESVPAAAGSNDEGAGW